jgi:glutamate dehydrogenase (NAD(P)+)
MESTVLLNNHQVDEAYDPCLEALLHTEEAARILDLEAAIVQRLRHCEREITVTLPLVRDNGEACAVSAFRVQHSTACGPCLGGVQLRPGASLGRVKALAMEKTWQLALLGIPFGGSAGAVICDPATLSERELRHLAKSYVCALRGIIGPTSDMLMQDVGSNESVLAWMLDSYSQAAGHLELTAVQSKPKALFGLADPVGAVAEGVALLVEEFGRCTAFGDLKVALQGFGRLGRAIAIRLRDRGVRMVGVADISGGLLHEDGLDVDALRQCYEAEGTLLAYSGPRLVSNQEMLEAACDVLVLAAAERQITAQNAERVRAPVVIAATHDAITGDGQFDLETHATVVPEILATGGGSAQAYLEWTMNTSGHLLLAGEAEEHLRRRMLHACHDVRETAERYRVSLSKAAYLRAVEQVATALRMRE